MLAAIAERSERAADSQHYVKHSDYTFRASFPQVIHESAYLFTSCRLHAKQNSFTVRASGASLTCYGFCDSCSFTARC